MQPDRLDLHATATRCSGCWAWWGPRRMAYSDVISIVDETAPARLRASLSRVRARARTCPPDAHRPGGPARTRLLYSEIVATDSRDSLRRLGLRELPPAAIPPRCRSRAEIRACARPSRRKTPEADATRGPVPPRRRRVRQRAQARGARARGADPRAPTRGSSASSCPCSTTSSAPCRRRGDEPARPPSPRAWSSIQRELLRVLEKFGVTSFTSVGTPFDPERHEAVARVPAAGQPEMTVVDETARGYLLNGRVLRPAMVTVAMSADRDAGASGAARRPSVARRTSTRVLGVPRDADDAALKSAYRKLARMYHPDKQSRRQGRRGALQGGQRGVRRSCPIRTSARSTTASGRWRGRRRPGRRLRHDLRGSLRGLLRRTADRGRRTRARRGDHLRVRPRDHARGGRRRARDEAPDPAARELRDVPRAPAQQPGTEPETCGSCRGQGQVRFSQGFLTVARPCPHVRRRGPDHPLPVQGLPRRGPRPPGAAAQR